MPFKSIHPVNHPELAALLLDQCQAELFQGPWENMIYLCDWISCPCKIPGLSTNSPAYQIDFSKEHSSCLPGLDVSFTSLREVKSCGRTCNLHANFVVAKLSSSLIPCLKKKHKICFPLSHYVLYPKGLLQYSKGESLFKYLYPNQKQCPLF